MQNWSVPLNRLRFATLSAGDREALRDLQREDRPLPGVSAAAAAARAEATSPPLRVFGRRPLRQPEPIPARAEPQVQLTDEELAEALRARLLAKRAERRG